MICHWTWISWRGQNVQKLSPSLKVNVTKASQKTGNSCIKKSFSENTGNPLTSLSKKKNKKKKVNIFPPFSRFCFSSYCLPQKHFFLKKITKHAWVAAHFLSLKRCIKNCCAEFLSIHKEIPSQYFSHPLGELEGQISPRQVADQLMIAKDALHPDLWVFSSRNILHFHLQLIKHSFSYVRLSYAYFSKY